MEKENPFTLSFGKEPKEYIRRNAEYQDIISDFDKENSTSNIYIITGVRGSGKTVLLTSLYKYFDEQNDYIAVDLNTRNLMLEDLAAAIYDKAPIKRKFLKPNFSFSFQGLSFSLNGENPVSSISQLLEKMLLAVKKQKMKVVITVDDIDTGEQMKLFVKEFQSLFRKDLPIYLVATGLYNIVDNLEKQEGLTFLQRGQKKYLSPLNIRYIASSYKSVFNVNDNLASELADLTKGYAFAYQTLGYLLYESSKVEITNKLLSDYDYYLEEYVYRRLFVELSEKEKNILIAIANKNINTNKELIEAGVVSQNDITRYKEKLFKKGVCDISIRGEMHIALPRFKEYLQYYYKQ